MTNFMSWRIYKTKGKPSESVWKTSKSEDNLDRRANPHEGMHIRTRPFLGWRPANNSNEFPTLHSLSPFVGAEIAVVLTQERERGKGSIAVEWPE